MAGFATGEGKAILTGFGDRYEGFFTFGKFNGQGSLFYHNGDVYEGNYDNGIPSGNGKMLFREAKVIINRNFNSRGLDRASTGELKNSTFEIKKREKKNHSGTEGPNK